MEFDRDLQSVQEIRCLVRGAREAQEAYAGFTQEQVDRIVQRVAQAQRLALDPGSLFCDVFKVAHMSLRSGGVLRRLIVAVSEKRQLLLFSTAVFVLKQSGQTADFTGSAQRTGCVGGLRPP